MSIIMFLYVFIRPSLLCRSADDHRPDVITLVGNKSDLTRKRAIDQSTAEEFAKLHKLQYVETSAKSGDNVETAFEAMAQRLYAVAKGVQDTQRPPSPRDTVFVPYRPPPKLHYMAKHNMHSSIVGVLAAPESDSSVNEVDARGYTALMYACEQTEPDKKIAQRLMRAKANANVAEPLTGMTALHFSAYYGHAHVVNILLKYKAFPDPRRKRDGVTPLMIAARQSNFDIALLLLQAKADPNVQQSDDRAEGATALHVACDVGCLAIVDLLCSHPETKVNLRRVHDRGTPLYAAVVKGHRSLLVRLVESKANVNIPNHKRITPLMTAKALGHDSLARVLKAANAKAWVGYSDHK